ncbi:ferredoxin reductase family protein [Micromonospora sp. NPDC049559]|uniref:ferredoxin reductase family protein n=1 Tax=Micromonospora sp. NPDC049559 TaxID=3155923 RepID=UPI00343D300F
MSTLRSRGPARRPRQTSEGWDRPRPASEGWDRPRPASEGWDRPRPASEGWDRPRPAGQQRGRPRGRGEDRHAPYRRPAASATPAAAGPAVPARRGPLPGWLVVGLLWLGLLASVLPWWLDTPTGSLRGTAAQLTAAGQITGLVAGYLLLVQVLLLSRLPVLERWIGAERLIRWHRDVGATVVVAVLAHLALIVVGYARLERRSSLGEAWTLLREYEDMLGAYAAAGIMVLLGLTGIRAVRALLPYELWYYLHLSSYATLLLGFGHQFTHGQQLFRPGPVRTGWIVAYVLVLAALLGGRVLVPLRLNLRHRLRVADVVAENRDTISIYLTGRRLDRLAVLGGQFFRWRFFAPGCWWQAHPFSLSAAGNGRWLRITVKVVGRHTADLRELDPGTPVWFSGPAGTFTAAHRRRDRALLIAGGTGITPIRALLEELPPGATLVYRARTPHDVLLGPELDWLAEARDVDLWYVVGSRDDPGPRQILSPRGLREIVPDVAERDVYLCGPAGLLAESVRLLRRAGVPRRRIHLATFEF